MSNCCPSNGAAWDSQVPGPILAVPPGTQVVATPSAYPGGSGCGCGGSSGAASGVTGGASGAVVPASAYPLLRQSVEVPAIGSNFQIYSTGASQWALAGMRVWFPPFGYAEITGVTGDLVTLRNLDITLGTVLGQGSPLLAFPPPVPVVVPVVPATVAMQYRKSRPRPTIYTQIRTGGAAWTSETVTRDLATYAGFDPDYKAALLYVNLGGYSVTRSFDLFVRINTIEYTRIRMGTAGASDASNAPVVVPIDGDSNISIEVGEYTNAGGTYGPCDLAIHLEGFIA